MSVASFHSVSAALDTDDLIPAAPGVYGFFLNIFRPESFGIYKTQAPSDKNREQIYRRFIQRLGQARSVFFSLEASGEIRAPTLSSTLTRKFELTLAERLEGIDALLNSVSIENVVEVLEILRDAWWCMPPLYIGIAKQQTLKTRYQQHRLDYLRNPKDASTFGSRLRNSKVVWEDLSFIYRATSGAEVSSQNLLAAESVLHLLVRPVLSKG